MIKELNISNLNHRNLVTVDELAAKLLENVKANEEQPPSSDAFNNNCFCILDAHCSKYTADEFMKLANEHGYVIQKQTMMPIIDPITNESKILSLQYKIENSKGGQNTLDVVPLTRFTIVW